MLWRKQYRLNKKAADQLAFNAEEKQPMSQKQFSQDAEKNTDSGLPKDLRDLLRAIGTPAAASAFEALIDTTLRIGEGPKGEVWRLRLVAETVDTSKEG